MVALANFVSRYHYVAYHCQWNDAFTCGWTTGETGDWISFGALIWEP